MSTSQLYSDSHVRRIHNGAEDILVNYDSVIFASYEDRKLFVIHASTLADDHEFVAPVIDLARRTGLELVSDVRRYNEDYQGNVERVRWFA